MLTGFSIRDYTIHNEIPQFKNRTNKKRRTCSSLYIYIYIYIQWTLPVDLTGWGLNYSVNDDWVIAVKVYVKPTKLHGEAREPNLQKLHTHTHIYIYIYTPGPQYKTTLKNEEK